MIYDLMNFIHGDLNVSLTMLACLAIILRGDEKRTFFAWRIAATQVAFLLFCVTMHRFIGPNPIPTKLVPVIMKYTLILVIAVGGVVLCYKVPIGVALINVATAFCVEHISQRTKSLILRYVLHSTATDSLLLLYPLTALFIYLFYHFFEKPLDRRNGYSHKVDFLQVFVSIAVVCTDIVYSFSFIYTAYRIDCQAMIPFVHIASILFSLLALVISYCHTTIMKKAYDLAIMQKIQSDERIRFEHDQKTIDLLNLKAHDLKHQLASLSVPVPSKEIASLYETLQAYDGICHTGVAALDVVLTLKHQTCRAQSIVFTHMIDSSVLTFMEDCDVYSLFGNLLDNAINAAAQVTIPSQRIISLTVGARDGMLLIHEENFFSGTLSFRDGLPLTTQADLFNHGFGTRSMQMIVGKYDGNMQIYTQNQIFRLDILVPMP